MISLQLKFKVCDFFVEKFEIPNKINLCLNVSNLLELVMLELVPSEAVHPARSAANHLELIAWRTCNIISTVY